jgi:hypothetical protein
MKSSIGDKGTGEKVCLERTQGGIPPEFQRAGQDDQWHITHGIELDEQACVGQLTRRSHKPESQL